MMNKGRSSRNSTRLLALVAALALVATACGNGETINGNGDFADGNGTEEGQDNGTAPAADGGTIQIGNPVTVVSLDPHGSQSGERSTLTIAQHFMDTLVEFRDDEIIPRLATDWDNPDDTTWVFQLRDDVEFHDGNDFTAEDVVASFERLVEEDGPLAALWGTVEEAEATGEHEVTFTTSEPLGTMLTNLTLLFIGPAAEINEADFWRAPIGTGAFVVDEFQPDGFIHLDAFDNYWDGRPNLDRLEFREIPETAARMTALETGEIDFTWNIPPDQVQQLEQADGITIEAIPSFTYYFIWFNNSEEPFTDERVRRAMWHAVDVEQIVEDLFPDLGEVASAPIPQPVFGSGGEQDQYQYDPDLAQELLAEAGFEDGFSTSIQWNSECCPNVRSLVQTMVSYWQDIGVEVELLEKERAEWLDDLLSLNWDMNIQDNTVLTGDADYTLGRLYLSEADRLGYANEELDELLLSARRELDQDLRADLYAQASQIIWEDAAGIFPIDLLNNFAWRDNVQGFEPVPNDMPRFHEVSLSE
jgi:peptide/nickel transport system substrate-binding protein